MNKNRVSKVISWRITSILITMLLMSIFLGNAKEASKVTIILHTLLTFFHYTFETLWEKFFEKG